MIVGPGTVVTKSISDDSFISGNPAKFMISTSKLLKKKGFLEIMEDVFLEYPMLNFLEKKNGILEYGINSKSLFIFDGDYENFDSFVPHENSIYVFKNIKKSDKLKEKKIIWFDLSKREMTSKKSKEMELVKIILRENGIRLLTKYQ